jgi:hypothetical protein
MTENASSLEGAESTINSEGYTEKELVLEISPQYATIQVIPKVDETNDNNFPRNLHNAAELFLRVGMLQNVETLKSCTDKMMSLYADNPDGTTGVRLGEACVCWNCGYCGLPKDFQEGRKTKKKTPPGPCNSCGETDQVNWVRVTSKKEKNISEMPWIEIAPLTKEEIKKKREAELSAKRAEVEANVKKALEERLRNENK